MPYGLEGYLIENVHRPKNQRRPVDVSRRRAAEKRARASRAKNRRR